VRHCRRRWLPGGIVTDRVRRNRGVAGAWKRKDPPDQPYQPKEGTALVMANFRAVARRRARKKPGPDRRRRWSLVASGVLVAAMIAALTFLALELNATTQRAPPAPLLRTLIIQVPPGFQSAHALVEFEPANNPFYTNQDSFFIPSYVHDVPHQGYLTGLDGRRVNTRGWLAAGEWKMLVSVKASRTARHAGKAKPLALAAESIGHSLLFAHFIDRNAGYGGNARVAKMKSYENIAGFHESGQNIWLNPYPTRFQQHKVFAYKGEAILSFPVEASAAGHVVGALPEIEVFRDLPDTHEDYGTTFHYRKVPFTVVVDDQYTDAGGPMDPQLSAVDISPPWEGDNLLTWKSKKPLQAHWSWDVTNDVESSQETANICLVAIGVASAVLVVAGGYLVKGLLLDRVV
jgi:hypothetical protein